MKIRNIFTLVNDNLKKIFFIYSFLSGFFAYSQFSSQKIISTATGLPVRVIAKDLNNDGNLDIAVASRSDNLPNSIAWFENIDGLGNFGPINEVGGLSEALGLDLVDIDNDDDLDILATSPQLDLVVYYENRDGLGDYGPRRIISTTADNASGVDTGDFDNDGDMDVVSASSNSGLAWYRNTDGNGTFSNTIVIDNTLASTRSVVAADMDGDGDLDILSNASAAARIVWIENMDGLGNFGNKHEILNIGSYANEVFAADVDGDGDLDIFTASPGDNEVAWYENLDGLGNFGTANIVSNTLESAWAVYVADLDNDGDMDILSTMVEAFAGEVVWFENLDGLGTFGDKNVITTEVKFPRDVYAADLDNDGDMDVLSASQNDNKISWYENFTILAVDDNPDNNFKVYPNPTKGLLYIRPALETIEDIEIYDITGRMIERFSADQNPIDISRLTNSVYFLKIISERGSSIEKIIKN